MAIIKKGILGGFSNKVGNVVGSSWKGISTMRSLPASYNDANSEAQQEQRSWFRFYSKLGSELLTSFIRPVLDPQAHRMSGYNKFVQQNLTAIRDGDLDPEVDPPIFSTGRLCDVRIDAILGVEGSDQIQYSLTSSLTCAFGNKEDDIYLIGLNDDHSLAWAGKVGNRGDETNEGSNVYNLVGSIFCPQFAQHLPEYWLAVAYSRRLKESSMQSPVVQISVG